MDLGALEAIQRERALAYGALDQAYKAYLSNKAEGPWRYAMRNATQAFQELSSRTRTIIASSPPGESEALEKLQQLEREKLRLTMTLYTLRLPAARGTFSWQQNDVVRDHDENHGCGHGSTSPSLEPTQEEHAAAVREAVASLEETVQAINDLLLEIRDKESA